MKRFIKTAVAVMLILTLLMSFTAFSFAAEKKYYDYSSYVLLGDSVASGWSDVEDRETRFVRVEGSYGAHVADDLGVDVYHPMACIGFRTTDLRYIFEEDYEADRFLYYSIDKELMDTVYAPAMRKAVAEADLITLNVGGNDWGSYVGWHVYEEMDKFEDVNEEFFTQARAYLENADIEEETIDSLIDIASLTGSLPRLVEVLPKALAEGFSNFNENWNYVIEDIYALNPDVTLVVIGMFDNGVQDQETADKNEAAAIKLSLGQTIVDIANKPMKENAEKYGYIYVDPVGTVCEKQHPSYAGHRHIADLILAALPDATFPYTDVNVKSKEYKAIETMHLKGIMNGVSETEFAPNENLTNAQLSAAINKIAGIENAVGTDGDAKRGDLAKILWSMKSDDFMKSLKTVIFVLKTLINNGKFDFGATLTRAEAAEILCDYIKL